MASFHIAIVQLCLIAAVFADRPLQVGTEPLNATQLHDACVDEHGVIYELAPSSDGVVFVSSTDASFGVKVVQSPIGGGCKADMYQACEIGDDGCQAMVACTDPSNQQRCVTCQPGKFQSRFRGQAKMFADCDSGKTPMRDATSEQQMEVLTALKNTIINECDNLKGCRFATESRNNLRISNRNNGTRFKFPVRRSKFARRLRKCEVLKEPIQTPSGSCRYSSRRLPYFEECPDGFIAPEIPGCEVSGTEVYCQSEMTGIPSCVRFPSNTTYIGIWEFNEASLTTLPAGLFDGLEALEALDITDHRLTTLPSDLFEGLSSLMYLTIQDANFTTVDPAWLASLPSLTYLELSDNMLASAASLAPFLSRLIQLDLDSNNIQNLSDLGLDSASNLELLSLRDNGIQSLPADIFRNLAAIKSITLRDNKLVTLAEDIFSGLTTIEFLDLGSNDFNTFPAGLFSNLTALSILRLRNLQLTSFPFGFFDGLVSLQSLALDSSLQLTTLPPGAFDDLAALTYFGAPGVPFHCCGDTYTQLDSIRDIVTFDRVTCATPIFGPLPTTEPLECQISG
eukprot:m.10238 g.10238  ORF g.10238 m.10238 type:complete len:567 (+) comp9619_c0_seq2:83-1783(+)